MCTSPSPQLSVVLVIGYFSKSIINLFVIVNSSGILVMAASESGFR